MDVQFGQLENATDIIDMLDTESKSMQATALTLASHLHSLEIH